MKKRKVIKDSSLPTRSPMLAGLVYWMLLDYCNAPGWAWGVVGTLWGFVFIAFVIDVFRVESSDVPGFGEK